MINPVNAGINKHPSRNDTKLNGQKKGMQEFPNFLRNFNHFDIFSSYLGVAEDAAGSLPVNIVTGCTFSPAPQLISAFSFSHFGRPD